MKVTIKTVQDRITILENLKTISINEEFQLACLRRLLPVMTAQPVDSYPPEQSEAYISNLQQRAEAAEAWVKTAERTMDHQANVITELGVRAEAAEAKLAEREEFEQGPVAILGQQLRGYAKPTFICELLIDEHNGEVEAGSLLFAEPFTHPAPAVSLSELVPDEITPDDAFKIITERYGKFGQDHHFCCDSFEVGANWRRAQILSNIEGRPADAAQTLDGKRIEFIQSLAEDPALLRGKSGLMRYKFDQHGFPVDGCIENATHYVARLIENGIVTHYAKSLYDFQEAIK